MEYRKFAEIPEKVSLLGFGGMRFPVRDDQPENIVEEGVQALIDHARERGITYFDTAYSYHGGRSEEVLSGALRKYPRNSYYLADKLPIWLIKEAADTEKYFMEQLERCQTEYFDFYLVHSLDRYKYEICEKYHVYDALKRFRSEGRIRHLGFSFHDTPEILEKIVSDGAKPGRRADIPPGIIGEVFKRSPSGAVPWLMGDPFCRLQTRCAMCAERYGVGSGSRRECRHGYGRNAV